MEKIKLPLRIGVGAILINKEKKSLSVKEKTIPIMINGKCHKEG